MRINIHRKPVLRIKEGKVTEAIISSIVSITEYYE